MSGADCGVGWGGAVIRVIRGDCRATLPTLESGSVQCCVTSPPYLGLRDYGVDGQIGLEASPQEYVVEIVSVFRQVWRVLRDDGTVWLNLGDSYARDSGKGQHKPGDSGKQNYIIERGGGRASGQMRLLPSDKHYGVHMGHCNQGEYLGVCCYGDDATCPAIVDGVPFGYKPKDLLMIPARVAIALQEDGWWLRSDIIYHKPNPMPESVTDRPTSSHEHVFLLTKAERYFYDGDAVREVSSDSRDYPTWEERKALGEPIRRGDPALSGYINRGNGMGGGGTRNLRNVWTISSQPFPESHFATFPPELAERCIKAGTSERGACSACGAPWVRIVTKGAPDETHRAACGADSSGGYNGQSTKGHAAAGVQDASAVKARILAGMRERISEWRPSCQCAVPTRPCVVLDCFAGAGTSLMVADRLGRDAIGIELNSDYCTMIERRLVRDAGLFAEFAT
jgi:DNA modification methylase